MSAAAAYERGPARSFSLEDAVPVLRRTPAVLSELLGELPEVWTTSAEGPNTWSPYDVVGHLIHGERTDWIPRIEHLLRLGEAEPFLPFDREAMFAASQGRSLAELLETFSVLRGESLRRLEGLALTPHDFERRGTHPHFGAVTLEQLLATWVVHDLTHISQIVRVMAHQYREAVGPWLAYLSVLGPRSSDD